MTSYPEAKEIADIIDKANTVVVVQADNPDTDSLASALALEHILGDLGKEPLMYSGVDLPSYLRSLTGSDRVTQQLPNNFDASIIVDTGSIGLLAKLDRAGDRAKLASRPAIIIDHHRTAPTIDFAKVVLSPPAVATGEVIYELALSLGWPLNHSAKKMLAVAILSDSLGLTSEATSARSIHIIGELVEGGVSLSELETARRETMRREAELIHYKGRLLQRVEFHADGRIATVDVPWEEIEKYSPSYNPAMLVIDDMRLGKDTQIAIVFKHYNGGKLTAKIRTNYGFGIADKLAEKFGGGGHSYAAGFKVVDGRDPESIKNQTITEATKLLDELKTGEAL